MAKSLMTGYYYRRSETHKSNLPTHFQKLCVSTLQIDMVKPSMSNPAYATTAHTVEALNEQLKPDYRLDIEVIEKNKPESLLVDLAYFKLKRVRQPIE
ncbi:MAG: hypothetical protein JSW59_14345 [Phycisphaerales bacterium]|nr:MAG: hypothetical protein JSW59_14345 [Phycisphaerales bacterium]